VSERRSIFAPGLFEGQTVVITGGGSGIGLATARELAYLGANVAIAGRKREKIDAGLAVIRADGVADARLFGDTCDIREPDQIAAFVSGVLARFGRIDVLVNNASMRNYASFADATPQEWSAVVGVNMIGNANFCRAALPHLRQAGKGSIVNVSSCYAVKGRKGMALYDATKAALIAMTRTLAFEETQYGIRANVICPGSTLTDFHVNRTVAAGKSVEELKTQRQDTSLLGRWADPIEMAFPILWFASDEASFITGTTLVVDGGLHIK
jgi:2-hydroxycyclohexanecarboxyl-CoA dehydrogenase